MLALQERVRYIIILTRRSILITAFHRIPRSDRAVQHVRILAERYPRTKFVSIIGDKCIPNLPDSRVPMLIVYKKGDIRNQIVAWGADQERRLEGELHNVVDVLLS